MLLWRYNVMWPDSGKGAWQPYARKWGHFVENWLFVPAVLAMVFALFVPRRRTGLILIATHLWALHVVAAVYLGGVRFRAPYDPIVILMAFEFVAVVLGVLWGALLRVVRRFA